MDNTPAMPEPDRKDLKPLRGFDEIVADLLVSVEPLARLVLLTELHKAHEAAELFEVGRAHQGGATWEAIGKSLGISKQAAHKRFACERSQDEEVEVARTRETRPKAWTVSAPWGRPLAHVTQVPADKLAGRAPVLTLSPRDGVRAHFDAHGAEREREVAARVVQDVVGQIHRWWERAAGRNVRSSTTVDGRQRWVTWEPGRSTDGPEGR